MHWSFACTMKTAALVQSLLSMTQTPLYRQKKCLWSRPAVPSTVTSKLCFSTHMCYIKLLWGQKHSCSQVLDDTAPFFGNALLSWNIKPHMKPQTYLLHNLQNNEGEVNERETDNGRRIIKLAQEWIKMEKCMDDECIHRLSLLSSYQWPQINCDKTQKCKSPGKKLSSVQFPAIK